MTAGQPHTGQPSCPRAVRSPPFFASVALPGQTSRDLTWQVAEAPPPPAPGTWHLAFICSVFPTTLRPATYLLAVNIKRQFETVAKLCTVFSIPHWRRCHVLGLPGYNNAVSALARLMILTRENFRSAKAGHTSLTDVCEVLCPQDWGGVEPCADRIGTCPRRPAVALGEG